MWQLPKLPYDYHSLEPYISRKTLEFHHKKHHQGYVDTLNTLVADLSKESPEVLLKDFQARKQKIFNNLAQVWNHTFYWHSMSPESEGRSTGFMFARLEECFKSLDAFKETFKAQGMGRFGSGYVWLLLMPDHSLKIETTANAETFIGTEKMPLLCCDLWEHSYYLDYQNRRADYLDAFLAHLINLSFAEENYKKYTSSRPSV